MARTRKKRFATSKKPPGKETTREQKDKKAASEKLRRRRINLLLKCGDLKVMCNTKVYVVIEDEKEQVFEFNSEELDGPWPPNRQILVRSPCAVKLWPHRLMFQVGGAGGRAS